MKRLLALIVAIVLLSGCATSDDIKMIEDNTVSAADLSDGDADKAEQNNSQSEVQQQAQESSANNTESDTTEDSVEDVVTDSYFSLMVSEYIEKEKADFELALANNPYSHIPPDESGKVMVVMFHNFVREYEEDGDRKITTTLDDFRLLLERLYNEGYRSVPLNDFIEGSISLPLGLKPIIFTFDDGKPSQFSFIKNEDGSLSVNPDTAVAVMEQFYNEYPDFGLNGTFFVNFVLGGTFGTVGTLDERVKAMAEKGFEIRNHTYSHVNLSELTTPEQVMEEVGKNAKRLEEIDPELKMDTLALPYGISNDELSEYIVKGTYDGYSYENKGIMLVGAEPAIQPYTKDADMTRIRRILASGLDPVYCDFGWWLDNLRTTRIFVSDGNPNTITIPSSYMDIIDEEKVKAMGKELIVTDTAVNDAESDRNE